MLHFSAYREEVHTLTNWCHNNNLSLNISKTKELVVDFRRLSSEHPPPTPSTGLQWSGSAASSSSFLGPHLDYSHIVSSDEGPPASLLPQATAEIWSELKTPQTVLQMHCGEHPELLHNCLVRELHCSQPESPAENSSDGPAHRRR